MDTHTLGLHRDAHGRFCSAAGDGIMRSCGYLKSCDYGETWCKSDSGLWHRYLYGLAIDSQDLDTMIVSAASDP